MYFLSLGSATASEVRDNNPPYPGLKYFNRDGVEGWEGLLSFTALFDSTRVKDKFTVRIELTTEPNRLPKVMEIGGRTDMILAKWVAKGKAKSLADLHVNSQDQSICLCPRPEEKKISFEMPKLEDFIQKLVIPYFFGLHEYEKTGKWIWGQYSHGDLGILEYYLEHRNDKNPTLLSDCLISLTFSPTKKQFNGREKCLCGSRLKFKKCHRKALQGYKAIREDQVKLELTPHSKV